VPANHTHDTGLAGCVAYFANPAWTRTSPFRVQAATSLADGSTRLKLEAASLVMAHGLIDETGAEPGTIANIVPLDREHMVHRAFRTEYLQGRTLVADDGSDWGRVAHVDTRTGHIRSTAPVQPRPGQRFTVLELAPGDSVRVMLNRWERFD